MYSNQMYFNIGFVSKQIRNTYLRLKIQELSHSRNVFIVFFKTNLMIIISVHQKSLKLNNHLNLCGQIKNSKWILSTRKTGVNCGHLIFFFYTNAVLICIFLTEKKIIIIFFLIHPLGVFLSFFYCIIDVLQNLHKWYNQF